MEPMERVVIDVPETYQGNVMTALGARKAILMNMQMMNNRSRLEFRMPSRGLLGYRSQFLTDTHGEGIMNTIFGWLRRMVRPHCHPFQRLSDQL